MHKFITNCQLSSPSSLLSSTFTICNTSKRKLRIVDCKGICVLFNVVFSHDLFCKELLPGLLEHGFSLTGKQLSYDSSKKRKEFLVLTCGQRSINASVSKGKDEDGESCSDDDDDDDEENQTVSLATALNSLLGFPEDVMNFKKKKIFQKVWLLFQASGIDLCLVLFIDHNLFFNRKWFL